MILLAGPDGSGVLRWRLAPGQLLQRRSWEDEHVVFNNLSGDTHLLDDAALALLLDLLDGPIDRAEFADSLPHEAEAISLLLSRLVGLGLVEAQPC